MRNTACGNQTKAPRFSPDISYLQLHLLNLEVGLSVKLVHKVWCRTVAYSTLKHDVSSEITVDTWANIDIAFFTQNDPYISILKVGITNTERPVYTGCPRRNVPDFGRVFLMLKYTDITQNTYVQSWTVTETMAREVWNFDSCYTLIDYQIHIKTGRNMWFL